MNKAKIVSWVTFKTEYLNKLLYDSTSRHSDCLENRYGNYVQRGTGTTIVHLNAMSRMLPVSYNGLLWWIGTPLLVVLIETMSLSSNLQTPHSLLSVRFEPHDGSIRSIIVWLSLSAAQRKIPSNRRNFLTCISSAPVEPFYQVLLKLGHTPSNFHFWMRGHHHLAFNSLWCFGKGSSLMLTPPSSWNIISPALCFLSNNLPKVRHCSGTLFFGERANNLHHFGLLEKRNDPRRVGGRLVLSPIAPRELRPFWGHREMEVRLGILWAPLLKMMPSSNWKALFLSLIKDHDHCSLPRR